MSTHTMSSTMASHLERWHESWRSVSGCSLSVSRSSCALSGATLVGSTLHLKSLKKFRDQRARLLFLPLSVLSTTIELTDMRRVSGCSRSRFACLTEETWSSETKVTALRIDLVLLIVRSVNERRR